MKKHWPQFAAFLVFTLGAFHAHAGTIFYVPIPASQSDANSGISTDNGYTSAVDGGNTRGTDRAINGITLYALSGNGQTSTADNCTLNALSGSLTNGGGTTKSIQLDGTFQEVASDMTFNNGAGDNSQQEIVLDPQSLEAGTTYDLRVYISNGSGQNRQVNLAFLGDGQEAVETGFFNEDDARTSAGGFKDQNQAYYINYRYTWDGDSTPGITITQKSGGAPFCLYALTNQVVPGGTAAASPAAGSPAAGAATAGEKAAPATGGEKGLSLGYVNEGNDEVGVSSDDFYGSDSLNSNGKWVNVEKWGKCWQPTNVASGWCPYTNGKFSNCDDCGWTFVSDEPWAWACYHYGRWLKVSYGCGWVWVPGKAWAGSWVSWRKGRTDSCSCIGWAPLPPEAGCEIGVGISTWVDDRCDIGPDYYTFINVRDFGSDSYSGCGCIYENSRNITVISETINITNICYNRDVTYCGGPDYNWCNTEIRRHGGKECEQIHVNRYDDPKQLGGRFSSHEGNQLGLVSPHVKNEKNPKFSPPISASLKSDKVDHGWNNVKDPKLKNNLKNQIAADSKGKGPNNTKATLPPDVAQKLSTRHGGGQAVGGAGSGAGPNSQQLQLGGKGQHPGKGNKGLNTQNLTTGGQTGAGAGAFDQHPGGKGKGKGQGQFGKTATGAGSTGAAGGSSAAFNQHPGGQGHKGQNANTANALGNQGTGAGGGNSGIVHHPGQSFKKSAQGGAASTGGSSLGGGTDQGLGQGGAKHKGKGQTGNQAMTQGATGQGGIAATGQGGTTGGQGGAKHKGKGQTGNQAMTQGGTGQRGTGATGQGSTGQGGTGQGGGKHKGKSQTGNQTMTQGGTSQGGTGATGQGGGGKHKGKSSQTNNQVLSQRGTGQGGGGDGGQSQMHHNQQLQQQQLQQQQLQQQKLQQQQLQQQQRQFQPQPGGGKKKKPTPAPR
jgi:hypothetical protein